MQLRPRQKVFVDKSVCALIEHGNTLAVAPTGSGKTVMMSAVARGANWGAPGCIVQHRDELIAQNQHTYWLYDNRGTSSRFTADTKQWSKDMTFAMIQTLARPDNLKTMPPLGFLAIDEAHHSAADSYLRVIDHAMKLNPGCKLYGVTATPNRGDKKALVGIFDNCADQITIREVIETGFLVKPRTFVIDIGVQDELKRVKRSAADYDMDEVAAIMDKEVLNDRIVEEWKKVANDRRTVVFCSTVAHATHVCETFVRAGVAAAMVTGEMPTVERENTLAAFDRGEIQTIVNVAVLTEGWDCQPVSCIVLLRPSSYKSTMIQMIGRGLRKVDPERYRNIVKDDCIVLDFGTSVLMHGSIEQDVNLEGEGIKPCPECKAIVPQQCHTCPICGHVFETVASHVVETAEVETKVKAVLQKFVLTEIDLLNMSPYRWESIFKGVVWIANAFDAWAVVMQYMGRWFAIGGCKGEPMRLLADNRERTLSLVTADDFLREHGDVEAASKYRSWLSQPPTAKQLQHLGLTPMNAFGMNRYRATCCITWIFNERHIRRRLEDATRQARIAA